MFAFKDFEMLVNLGRVKLFGKRVKRKNLELAYRRYLAIYQEHGEKIGKVYIAFYLTKAFSLKGDNREDFVDEIKHSCQKFFKEDFSEITWESCTEAFPKAFDEIGRKLDEMSEVH